jgi:uncharacterized protein (TIGR03435 family)
MKCLLLLTAMPCALLAQALEGTWQGTVMPPNQNREMRIAFKITKQGSAHQGIFYNLETGRQFNLGAIALEGNAVKVAVPGLGAAYDGKLSADGNSIDGTLTLGTTAPMPLPLKRATPANAWELPPPPSAPKPLPEGTKLEFEVASIRPVAADQPGGGGFNVSAIELRGRNSLAQLITFAFVLHRSQISGLPGWAESERYDIAARLPQGGDPSDAQIRTMLQNLIQSRFGLSFHMEQRELSVYAIGIGKKGPAGIKMVKNTTSGARTGAQSLGRVRFQGTTMANLASMLQMRVLDRPVVDQSGLTDRYDFTLDWRPDEFQFPNAPPAQRAAAIAGGDALPDLFGAFQDQLGMKLEATKARADVLVIEKVSRPSEN